MKNNDPSQISQMLMAECEQTPKWFNFKTERVEIFSVLSFEALKLFFPPLFSMSVAGPSRPCCGAGGGG